MKPSKSESFLKNDPNFYQKYIKHITLALDHMEATTLEGDSLVSVSREIGLETWCRWTRELAHSKGALYFIGNGASASMASHMSADATKNGMLKAHTFNDQSLMTAISNDIDYREVYALPIQRFCSSEDILVTISSSGNSPNIIRAIDAARNIKMKVITLSGMGPENQSRKMGDLNFWVPAEFYGIVESSHQTILHSWLDKYLHEQGKMV